MIEKIEIKKIATFDEIGVQITDLKKINFIYGANGSGKTTITKFVQNPSDELFQDCSIKWKGDTNLKTLVYNKVFRDKNFGNGSINGVFTLGQATKEDLELIQKKSEERAKIKDEGIKKKETLDKLIKDKENFENSFKEDVWYSIYKKYETDFKEAFKGTLQKASFRDKLLTEFSNNTSPLLKLEELQNKANTIFNNEPKSLIPIKELDFSVILEIEQNPIWTKKILGKADIEIAKLIQRLNLNDWVYEGKKYLQENNICPFCQQDTITKDFRVQIENYFDETFQIDTKTLNQYADDFDFQSNFIINALTLIETTEKSNKLTKLDTDTFSILLKSLSSILVANKEKIISKQKEPSRSIELNQTFSVLTQIHDLILKTNTEIESHNKIVNNLQTERRNLINSIWKFIIETNRQKIETYNKSLTGRNKGIESMDINVKKLRTDFKTFDDDIKNLSKNVTSVQPTVDEINRILKSYGFDNFLIVPSTTEKNQYQIQRKDGSLAETTLSEGEITFITFLYFLQLAKGSQSEDTITKERVLIIDDPISSLDSNILFVVSSLLKEYLKDCKNNLSKIKQIILFTHNVYFHKEVSFIDGRTKENGDTFFWILRKNDSISAIQCYEMKNPIQNSYELLWQEIKNNSVNSSITIQNTMRRIIENYFKLLGKYGDDELIQKFTNKEEQDICRSLICWINDGSHSVPDDIFIEYPENTIDKYLKVFKDIFKHTNHLEHYKMMMNERN